MARILHCILYRDKTVDLYADTTDALSTIDEVHDENRPTH